MGHGTNNNFDNIRSWLKKNRFDYSYLRKEPEDDITPPPRKDPPSKNGHLKSIGSPDRRVSPAFLSLSRNFNARRLSYRSGTLSDDRDNKKSGSFGKETDRRMFHGDLTREVTGSVNDSLKKEFSKIDRKIKEVKDQFFNKIRKLNS